MGHTIVGGDLAVPRSGRWLRDSARLALWLIVAGIPVSAMALTQDELNTSRNLWSVQGLNDYDYVLQRFCFCIEEARRPGLVEVHGGEIARVTDAETLDPLDPLFFRTVDGLFDELQSAIDVSAHDIQAQFDSTFSYPTSISIDYDEAIADEELIYAARDLRVIETRGDFNGNGMLDIDDLDSLTIAIANGNNDPRFDVDQSGVLDPRDLLYWVRDLKQTWIGDADLNGEFNSGDLVGIFQQGEYEDDLPLNSTWRTGDWDGDGDFTTSDLVTAFTDGGYEQGRRAAARSVPEPTGISLLAITMALSAATVTRRRVCKQ